MKSTKVQNLGAYYTYNARLLATPGSVAVLPGQFSLLRGLAALVCLVWERLNLLLVLQNNPTRCDERTTASHSRSLCMPQLLNEHARTW